MVTMSERAEAGSAVPATSPPAEREAALDPLLGAEERAQPVSARRSIDTVRSEAERDVVFMVRR